MLGSLLAAIVLAAPLHGDCAETRAPADVLATFLTDLSPALDCTTPIEAAEIPAADWTFFVHIAADNDLARWALEDLREMTRAGSSAGRLNVLAFVDGPPSWGGAKLVWIPPAGTGCGPREVLVDPSSSLARHLAEPNMGDPAALRAALSYVQERVPSRRVFLDIWNHGAGWRGIGYDDSHRDHLDFASGELAAAIDGLRVDVLGADACLTATLEVARAAASLRSSGVRALVASQETEPAHGWNYADLLPRLAGAIPGNGQDPPIFDVVAEAVGSYAATGAETMSAIDLRTESYVVDQWGKLARAILDAGGLNDNTDLRNIYEASLRFGSDRELMDVGDFARRIAERFDGELRSVAINLLGTLRASAVHATGRGGAYSRAEGLSVYAPLSTPDPRYLAATTPWHAYLHEWNAVLRSRLAPPSGMPAPVGISAVPAAPQPATSWSARRRLPIALVSLNAFGDGEVYLTGFLPEGASYRSTGMRVDPATRTITLGVALDEPSRFDGEHENMFGGRLDFTPPPGTTGRWSVAVVYSPTGEEIARTEWWSGK